MSSMVACEDDREALYYWDKDLLANEEMSDWDEKGNPGRGFVRAHSVNRKGLERFYYLRT